jgi:hypothetical protein
MGANATPHFVKGIIKEAYPNVVGGSPVSNLVAGWAGLVVAALPVSWHMPSATRSGRSPPAPWVSCS